MKKLIGLLALSLLTFTWAQAQDYSVSSPAYNSDGKPGSNLNNNQIGNTADQSTNKANQAKNNAGQQGTQGATAVAGTRSGGSKMKSSARRSTSRTAGRSQQHARRNRIMTSASKPTSSQAQQAPVQQPQE